MDREERKKERKKERKEEKEHNVNTRKLYSWLSARIGSLSAFFMIEGEIKIIKKN